MFCVGDIVVYGAHGLCKVDGIGPLPMKLRTKANAITRCTPANSQA